MRIVPVDTPITRISIARDDQGSDELLITFYSCSLCGFDRVPRMNDDSYSEQFGDSETMTARYCPGCGKTIKWY